MPSISPILSVDDIARSLDYYESVLGFKKGLTLPGDDGKLTHGEAHMGDLMVMFGPAQHPENVAAAKLAQGAAKGVGVLLYFDLGEQDIDRYFEDVKKAGAKFVEEIKDGPEFLRVLRATARKKPVVILKAGRTEAGRRAAASHTGSLAGSREAVLAALRQAGALVARTTEEFFDVAMALDWYGDRLPANDRVAIMTVSGGPCVIASDAAEEQGLAVPPLREAVRSSPPWGTPWT